MFTTLYIGVVRQGRSVAARAGLLARLERRRDSRAALWLRSLFSIYDIDDLAQLDLPWWTFAAIGEVDRFLKERPNARAFEYGSGASTIWLARRVAQVVSVEHDAAWHGEVERRLAPFGHARVRLVPPDAERSADPQFVSRKPGWRGQTFRDYVHAIDAEPGLFDLIVIDGRARPACLDHARARLAPDGMIVFDNTHRPAYRRAIAASGMHGERLRGLAACLPYPDETTLMRLAPAA
jgi:predicted O-methyltransferase YrrM